MDGLEYSKGGYLESLKKDKPVKNIKSGRNTKSKPKSKKYSGVSGSNVVVGRKLYL